jgi:hypothetical protein
MWRTQSSVVVVGCATGDLRPVSRVTVNPFCLVDDGVPVVASGPGDRVGRGSVATQCAAEGASERLDCRVREESGVADNSPGQGVEVASF